MRVEVVEGEVCARRRRSGRLVGGWLVAQGFSLGCKSGKVGAGGRSVDGSDRVNVLDTDVRIVRRVVGGEQELQNFVFRAPPSRRHELVLSLPPSAVCGPFRANSRLKLAFFKTWRACRLPRRRCLRGC